MARSPSLQNYSYRLRTSIDFLIDNIDYRHRLIDIDFSIDNFNHIDCFLFSTSVFRLVQLRSKQTYFSRKVQQGFFWNTSTVQWKTKTGNGIETGEEGYVSMGIRRAHQMEVFLPEWRIRKTEYLNGAKEFSSVAHEVKAIMQASKQRI